MWLPCCCKQYLHNSSISSGITCNELTRKTTCNPGGFRAEDSRSSFETVNWTAHPPPVVSDPTSPPPRNSALIKRTTGTYYCSHCVAVDLYLTRFHRTSSQRRSWSIGEITVRQDLEASDTKSGLNGGSKPRNPESNHSYYIASTQSEIASACVSHGNSQRSLIKEAG